jgi:TRAP-type C4-dicarboxylate transport system permease small subunit
MIIRKLKWLFEIYTRILKHFVLILAAISGFGIMAMIFVTTLDVVLRLFGVSFIGAYDIVYLSGAITIATALPYTTAVKGHVAIEYFFLKLSRTGRIVVDTIARLLGISLFGILAWHSLRYAESMRKIGQVTSTLQIPVFWVPQLIALSCAITTLVILHNLFHPGKEMIKP